MEKSSNASIILILILFINIQKLFAQNEQGVTVPQRKLEVINKNYVLPTIKHPSSLCSVIQDNWANYLNRHKTLNKKFGFDNDSNNYYVSFWIEINKKGEIKSFKKKKNYTLIESVCYDALENAISHSVWNPFYEKSKKKIFSNTTGILNFQIEKGIINSVHISEINTGAVFFKCDN